MRAPEMGNPTLVFITDRNDLDDQLFGEVFAPARILPETAGAGDESAPTCAGCSTGPPAGSSSPRSRSSRPRSEGDVHPVLTDRRNVVVVADEAHRSPVRLPRRLRPAPARRPAERDLPRLHRHADRVDRPKSTRQVFGDYIDVYDLTRAVEDGATVRIFYESRLAKVSLPEEARAELDDGLAAVTETQESARRRPSGPRSRWGRVEAIVGADERLDLIAADIVEHWEKRRDGLIGKAMIVCMSRRIAVELYERIVALRPDWHDDDPAEGHDQGRHDRLGGRPAGVPAAPLTREKRSDLKARAKDPDDRWRS